MTSLDLARGVVAVDPAVRAAARARIDALTKPPGSLGRVETLAECLAGIAGGIPARPIERAAVLLGAADHGVVVEGVSAYPAEVTRQMVATFLDGRAAINAFARAARADVYVADFGTVAPLAPHPSLIDARVGPGTRNFAREPAMSLDEVEAALAAGASALEAVLARGPYDVVALGEMGIGNTTSAAAVTGALASAGARRVVGRGTGADDATYARKIAVVAGALASLGANPTWQDVACGAGGFEIVGLAGAILAAAGRRVPVVLDGFIVGAAALIAARIAPAVVGYCIAAHRSVECGHAIALDRLGLDPLLDLGLRLGEGSGAALALPIVEAASRMIVEMRTFAEAGVSDKS